MEEGALELYYGCVGDINTTAVNPICGTMFSGWQEGYDSSIIVRKSDVNLNDLAALTAKTGDEFAMFTRGSQRLVIRGGPTNVNIDCVRAQELFEAGYKWSGHTHPGMGYNVKIPSLGDKCILNIFNQEQSVIYDSKRCYK